MATEFVTPATHFRPVLGGAIKSSCEPSTEGQIGSQLSKLENDLDNLSSVASALARRLLPVTGMDIDLPVDCEAKGDASVRPSQVPLADRIEWLRERLNNSAVLLDKILNRIEI